jgi:MATE family multidrug resistance protein
VTVTAILGNLVNIGLDYVLIFGLGSIPSFGIPGAAFATGISQLVQTLFLIAMILRIKNRSTYRTGHMAFYPHFFQEGLKIGTPSGLGHMVEVIAHFLFFRIVMSVGQSQMTIVAMVQSLYILFSFINDSACKAASAIASNLLGAEVRGPLKRVLRSAFTLQFFYFLLVLSFFLLFPDFLIELFIADPANSILAQEGMRTVFIWALFFMSLFFLFDGFGWILIGFLTASGDTRFIFWTSLIVHWAAYIGPTIFLIGIGKGGADTAWSIIAGMSLLNAMIYFIRYRSGIWLKKYQRI